MKYLILAAILVTTTSSAFAESSQESTAGSLLGSITSSHGGQFRYKNVENAHEREDAIKASLDEKSDASEQKTTPAEE